MYNNVHGETSLRALKKKTDFLVKFSLSNANLLYDSIFPSAYRYCSGIHQIIGGNMCFFSQLVLKVIQLISWVKIYMTSLLFIMFVCLSVCYALSFQLLGSFSFLFPLLLPCKFIILGCYQQI